jgi:hypothetical protein
LDYSVICHTFVASIAEIFIYCPFNANRGLISPQFSPGTRPYFARQIERPTLVGIQILID